MIPQETYSPLSNLRIIRPNILMESDSHNKNEIDTLSNYMKTINGKIIIVPYYNGQSSTRIKELIKSKG